MSRILFIILFLFSSLALAAEDAGGGGDEPPPTNTEIAPHAAFYKTDAHGLSQKQEDAFRKLTQVSECSFVLLPGMVRQRTNPSIVKVAVPCGKAGRKIISQCYGPIYCTNNVSPFYLENAICWSKDGRTCPSANQCAQSSFFDSVGRASKFESAPVFQQSSGTVE